MSIFPIWSQLELFGVDCNLDINNQTVKAFILYKTILDKQTQYIKDFEYNTTLIYYYADNETDTLMDICRQRLVEPISLLDYIPEDMAILYTYAQYCPFNKVNVDVITSFDKIYIINIMYEPVQYFTPLTLNVDALCHPGQLVQLIPNMLLRKFSESSWNIGLLQYDHSGICKCQVEYEAAINKLSPICTYTKLLFFQDAYFQSLHVLNDDLVLLSGNNYSVQIIKLDDSINVNDYQNLVYKDIYTEGYYIVDATITTSYVNIILSQNPENYNYKIIQMCLAKNYVFENGTNILKIFQIQENRQEVYYQLNVPTNAKLLANYNYMTLSGQYISIYLVSEQPQIFLKKVYNKMIIVQYQSNQTYICDQSQQVDEYYAVVAQFNISGLLDNKQVSLTRYLVVCIIQYNNEVLNLVASRVDLNLQNFNNRCPNPIDKLYYNFRTNQIDLLKGVMGPLLYYEYIPDPIMTQFYPFYQDYIYKLDHKKILDEKIYKLYYSEIKDSDSDNTVLGKLEIVTSIQAVKNLILYYMCDLKSLNQFQDQIIFNLYLVVSDCELRQKLYINTTLQIDYYKKIDEVEFFVDFKTSQLYFTIDGYEKLDDLDNFNFYVPIKQFDIQKSNEEYKKQYYEITILTDQLNIQFYYFSIDYISAKVYNASELYFKQNILVDQAQSFQYFYIGQKVISILSKSGAIDFYTYGSILSNSNPLIPNFTNLVYTYQIDQCANNSYIGFEIIEQESDLNVFKKYLLVWCQVEINGYDNSIILQYHIDSINQIYFWRQLPIYNQSINITKPIIISGNILYLPIITQTMLTSRYYIYNLIDYSGRMLFQQFDIKNDYVLASPCVCLSFALQNKHQSFTYFITAHEQFLYYINSEAQFIFNQRNATSLYQNLTIGIYQPTNKVTLFRTYELFYNKYVNEIFAKKKVFKINLTESQTSYETGYYTYTISISQKIFIGPITNYEAFTNNSNVTLVPGQYIQFNKYMGTYVDSIELYGNIQQMLSLSNPQYASFYGFDIDPTFNGIEIYQDIILVLTSKALLFLQTNSYKDSGPFDDCDFLNYNQSQQNPNNTCAIRKIHVYNIEKEIQLEFCKIEIFYITQIALICLNNTSPNKRQNLKIINYEYIQDINQIIIKNVSDTYSEYYQLFFSRYRTFLYNNNPYLASETSFQNSQSYFQIYLIVISNFVKLVTLQPKIIQGLQAPVQKSSDFSITLLYNNGTVTLVILILQPDSILYLNIDLENLIVIERKNIIIQQLVEQISKLIIFYINFQNINFLTVLQTLNYYPNLPILIGNIGYNLEVLINLTNLTLLLQYTFVQDQICQYNIIQLPQYLLSKRNGTIEYLVTVCLNFEFNYQTIYQEMVYLFGYQNQNLIYTTLFVRENSNEYSFPVQIMETVFISPKRLQFYNYQVYRAASYQNNTAHILMTNYTYFLVDYEIYATFIFDVLYPIQDSGDGVIVIDVYASNQIKNTSVQYLLYLPPTTNVTILKNWFYFILAMIVLSIFCLCVKIVNGKVRQARKIRKQSITFKLNGKSFKYEQELEAKNGVYD